ncbi:MAG: hypothetical protein Dbin4_02182 [Alphaproteobacteria bacterium]|nr:hypothetical protein [Alphaproteobacteria bacterium]
MLGRIWLIASPASSANRANWEASLVKSAASAKRICAIFSPGSLRRISTMIAAETDLRLKRLYDAIESGVADLDDPALKERITNLNRNDSNHTA